MEARRAGLLPLVIGAAALGVGLLLGLSASSPPELGNTESGGTAPGSAAPASPGPASTAPESPHAPPAAALAPNLDGPDVGKVVLSEAKDVAALSNLGDRLVWLTTDRGRLRSAASTGGPITELFVGGDATDFGGALVTGPSGIYWTVERLAGDSEPILFLPANATKAPAGPLDPLAPGTSPANLVLSGDTLSWSDLGAVFELRRGTAPMRRAKRDRRIATMTGCGDTLYWIEVPYAAAAPPSLMRLARDADEPDKVAAILDTGEHDLLRCDGEQLFWALGGAPRVRGLYRAPSAGGRADRLLATGDVVALAIWRGELIWVEAHGSEAEPIALLRRLRPDGELQRLGRDSGHVSALTVDDGSVYWATEAGIKRLALE